MIQNKMDISMLMKKFFQFSLLVLLASCGGYDDAAWVGDYSLPTVNSPATLQYGTPPETSDEKTHTMAVLLPMTGPNAAVGNIVRNAVEVAILQRTPKNLTVSFYDTNDNAQTAISTALGKSPDVIIGPFFSGDTRYIRDTGVNNAPVLSFTSDVSAVGRGVMTMALLPTNGTEAIVQEMSRDKIKSFIILAPDTESGHLMAGTAKNAAYIYDIPLSGIYYYQENNTESIKNATIGASMNKARSAANIRAKEILSDILTKNTLSAEETADLTAQLDNISKTDTLGPLPYDGILFLGNGDDTESLASFLRYYGVGAKDARFYGTALWDGSDITSDFTMSGAKYVALPEISPEFTNIYEQLSGNKISHLAAFGYDATNMAINMMYSDKSTAAYLLDPSGYIGSSGLFKLIPDGTNHRALRIMKLNTSGTAIEVSTAPTDFLTPIYNIAPRHIVPADAMALETTPINPMDYITIPARFQNDYPSKTPLYTQSAPSGIIQRNTVTIPQTPDNTTLISPDFQPINLEHINRTYIDSVIIEE